MDALFLKVHVHAEVFQHSGVFEAVDGVSGEAGDRLANDHIHLALLAEPNHFIELITLFYACSRDALVGVYCDKCPIGFFVDSLCVVVDLVFIAVQLLVLLGGYAAVGDHSQLSVCGFDAFADINRRRYNSDHSRCLGSLLHCMTPFL